MNTEFVKFVRLMGSQKEAAKAIGVTAAAINHYLHGRRQIGPALAEKIERISGCEISKTRLVWPKKDASDNAA